MLVYGTAFTADHGIERLAFFAFLPLDGFIPNISFCVFVSFCVKKTNCTTTINQKDLFCMIDFVYGIKKEEKGIRAHFLSKRLIYLEFPANGGGRGQKGILFLINGCLRL